MEVSGPLAPPLASGVAELEMLAYQRTLGSCVYIQSWRQQLAELSRSVGIIIRMYAEPGVPHHRRHFHAYYQNHVAIYGIDPIEQIGGDLPRRQQRLVEAWGELRQGEFLENWERLQSGCLPYRIAPLR